MCSGVLGWWVCGGCRLCCAAIACACCLGLCLHALRYIHALLLDWLWLVLRLVLLLLGILRLWLHKRRVGWGVLRD